MVTQKSGGGGNIVTNRTRRPLSAACHARFMCSAPAFCAWRRLPL